MRTQLTIGLSLLLLLTNCSKERMRADAYIAVIPFASSYSRNINMDIINDSAFVIYTRQTTPDIPLDIVYYLTISYGKIYRIDNYFYAKDELSGEKILYSKDGNALKLYNSRYAGLVFEKDQASLPETETEEDQFRIKEYFKQFAKEMNSYKEKSKARIPVATKSIEFFKDSIIEFSNRYDLRLILNNDSVYHFTFENLLFSTGDWQIINDSLIFTESIIFRNRHFPSDLPEKVFDFIEQSTNIYSAWMLNDSTLFMGTLPFAQTCNEMKIVKVTGRQGDRIWKDKF
ncbi:MAG: hypothetical protein JNL22_15285 [Bacteroidales bacterium]|nr:hypothetical protein [Bacteroidales bacterium]